ncbi:MAG: FimB/Mfa2 family fimbrial subunit [Mangrovibacterium sp.]
MTTNVIWNKNRILFVLSALMAILPLSSCIKDNLDDCGIDVRFDYSYNMLSSNSFGVQADRVSLYVFDEPGTLVLQQTSRGDALSNDYRLHIEALKAGKYRFVAWSQGSGVEGDAADFDVPVMTVGSSSLGDLTYSLKRTDGVQQHELNTFLVGTVEAEIESSEATRLVTVNLKKVTRKIRVILLPYTGGSQLDVSDYDFKIVDEVGSGCINYDYSVLPDEAITYWPYYAANVQPNAPETLSPGEVDRAAVVELNTSRLIESHNPRLVISGKTSGEEIVRLNLPWFLSLTEMESHRQGWNLQEYLDRQDKFALTFFLNQGSWMQGTIIINGWVINNLEIEI